MNQPLTPQEADRLLASLPVSTETQTVPLARAGGRILRQSIRADRPLPPYDRSTMDGVALRQEDLASGQRRFRVAGEAQAGRPARTFPHPGSAVLCLTGAIVPAGSGLVVPLEHYELEGNEVVLHRHAPLDPGQFIHRRGSDCTPGTILVPEGARLGPAEIATAAACGCHELTVARPPRIALLTCGDEVVPVDSTPQPWQIRQSNLPVLRSLLAAKGLAPCREQHLGDAPAVVRDGLAEAAEAAEIILTSAGISAGSTDHLPTAWRDLGFRELFRGLRQKPGRPMACALGPGDRLLLALPGNPLSTLICACRYALPSIDRWMGGSASEPSPLPLAEPVRRHPQLTLFAAVHLEKGAVRVSAMKNSGDLTGWLGTSGFVEIPPGDRPVEAGEALPYRPWP